MELKELLKNYFNFDNFRPGQEEIINAILSGNNVLAVLPTGGGKSICYQIPALASKKFSIVVSPLIALMKNQVDSLNKYEPISAFINSTIDYKETDKVLNLISQNKLKILYVSPEKLDSASFSERMRNLKPDFIFIDEAHCISEWGHNFRPSYRKIKTFIDFVGVNSVSAFTATATEDVRNDIIEQLGMQNVSLFVRGFERNNLSLNVIETTNKKEKLLDILKKNQGPSIIYAATRKITEDVTDFLRANHINAVYYHAGITTELRRIIQDDFQSDRIQVITATNAFGMGIDKSNIRTVIHFNLPPSIENYYQEIGRAGRDGLPSNIYLLYDKNDKQIQEYFIRNSYPSKEQIELVYTLINDFAGISVGSISDKDIILNNDFTTLLNLKNINKNQFESTLKILQESGYVTDWSYQSIKHSIIINIEPNRLNTIIKSIDDNELKDLLIILLREYGSNLFSVKTSIDLNKISRLLEYDISTVTNHLEFLSQSGIIDYTKPSTFPSIRIIKPRVPVDEIVLNYKRILSLSEHSYNKLKMMINYVNNNQCRFKFILEYFGEIDNTYRCGNCDLCRGEVIKEDNSEEFIINHIISLITNSKLQLNKKDLVNCLLGKTADYRLVELPEFGSCMHHTKKEIEFFLNKLISSKQILVESSTLILGESFTELDNENSYNKSNKEYEVELEIYNTLRQIRKDASVKFNQQPQLICSDAVLKEIAIKKPTTATSLLELKGFNQKIMNKIGQEILSAINDFENKQKTVKKLQVHGVADNIYTILDLIKKKYSLEDICKLTKLPESVVSVQIETLIHSVEDLDIDYIFTKEELNTLINKLKEGIVDIKKLRAATNEKISYAKLRIALAKKSFIE